MSEYTQYIQAFGMPGGWEWLIILVVALLIFGKRLPDVARSVGKSLTAFKKGMREVEDAEDEVRKEVDKAKDEVVDEVKKAADLDNKGT